MWGRKEDQSHGAQTLASASPAGANPSEAPPRPSAAPPKPTAPAPATPSAGTSHIGQSINFKGEIHSEEDFSVDGSVDGSIFVPKHSLVIGSASKVRATIEAHSVLIRGQVEGKINASDKVEISNTGRFKGDLITRRLVIHDGAIFVGDSAVHQAKPASPAPPSERKAEARPKPPDPSAKPAPLAPALQSAPPPEKKAEPKTPASPAAPAPPKAAPAAQPAPPDPVPASAILQRPLPKP